MDVKFISKDELKRLLGLINSEQIINLLATFNIKAESEITSNTLKGMVSYLNKINKTSIEVDLKDIRYTSSAKIEVENLEELIKKRKKSKPLPLKVETLKNKTVTKPIQEIEETSNNSEILMIESIIPQENKIPQIKEITSKEKQEKVKISKEQVPVKEIITKDKINPGILKLEQQTKIKKVIPEKKTIRKELRKNQPPKDKKKIVDISLMQQRYELYIENCKKNEVEPVPIELYKTIKNYPIESNYIFHKSLKNTIMLSNGLRKITNYKDASKIYNSGYIVYYTSKNADTKILCKLDITKPFTTNLNPILLANKDFNFEFYTKCEKFDTNLIENLSKKIGRIWTEEEDTEILSFYNSSHYGDANKKSKSNDLTLKELAKKLNVYSHTIRNRAIQLGFTNFKKPREKNWSKEEYDLLDKCVGKYNPKKISKIFKTHGFTRGAVAIAIKLKRLGFSLKLDGSEELNLTMLSELMGVDTHFFYDNDRLKKLNARKENSQTIFTKKDISLYLKDNPYDYPLARVEPKWFIDMLTNKDL